MNVSSSRKRYFIDLNKRRSIWALIAASVVSVVTFFAVVGSVVENLEYESSFHYFTILSNLLSATGAFFMVPYAVEGIRKKRFSVPKWICVFQYVGTVGVFITMFCAAVLIAPMKGIEQAYTHNNFWLHLVTPVMAVVLFLTVESGHVLTKKDALIAQVPLWAYCALYGVMVVLVGQERGGWSDIYGATSIVPFPVAVAMVLAIGFLAANLFRVVNNRKVARDTARLSAQWSDDTSPYELKIEAFGLGRYMAAHQDQDEVLLPMDIFEMMAKQYDVSVEDLVRAYTKGLLDKRAGK